MEICTSKIDLTDKLRKLGLWEQASVIKDQCRRRLVKEGLTRKEANERAWAEIDALFSGTNLERILMAETLVMADCPPAIPVALADIDGEVPFNFVWQMWCCCLARLERWEQNDFDAAAIASATMLKKTTAETQSLVDQAINNSIEFVREVVAPKFLVVVRRLEQRDDFFEDYISELRAHIQEMERFGFRA